MTFQATFPVSIGLVFTPWDLDSAAILASVSAVVGGVLAYRSVERRDFGGFSSLAWTALFIGFLLFVTVG